MCLYKPNLTIQIRLSLNFKLNNDVKNTSIMGFAIIDLSKVNDIFRAMLMGNGIFLTTNVNNENRF